MSSFDPLGLRPSDPLERWDAERQEREFAEAQREREERRAVGAAGAARLRAEFDAWRAKQTEDRRQEMTAVAEFVGGEMDKLVDRFEAHATRMRNAMMDAVEVRLTALEMQLKAAESRVKGQFQFAREKDDADDLLPNPLSTRRHQPRPRERKLDTSLVDWTPRIREATAAEREYQRALLTLLAAEMGAEPNDDLERATRSIRAELADLKATLTEMGLVLANERGTGTFDVLRSTPPRSVN